MPPQGPLLPGGTIGFLGGGQLGRMLALEARRMGYKTAVLDSTERGPAAQVCDHHEKAAIDDSEAARRLARRCDLLTLEWENIPGPVLSAVESERPLYPAASVLAVIQDRLVQREFLRKNGYPQAEFVPVEDASALAKAAEALGYPCVLKARRLGYDGRGQLKLEDSGDLDAAAALLAEPCVLEAWVPFKKELSAVLARGRDGRTASYPVPENVHRAGILRATRVPADVPDKVKGEAVRLGAAVAESLGHVGVLAVELFLLEDGRLLVNEIAPRVHNSGHFTLGACATSQFEQHVRAVCGLPLGPTTLLSPAVMLNLLGELWAKGEPAWEKLLSRPDLKLHLYGKSEASQGRKMGHVLLMGPDPERLLRDGEELLKGLGAS